MSTFTIRSATRFCSSSRMTCPRLLALGSATFRALPLSNTTQAAASLSPGWNKFGSERGFGRTRVADRCSDDPDLLALAHQLARSLLWNRYRYVTISTRVRIVNTVSSGRIYPSPYYSCLSPDIAPKAPKG